MVVLNDEKSCRAVHEAGKHGISRWMKLFSVSLGRPKISYTEEMKLWYYLIRDGIDVRENGLRSHERVPMAG
jgi:hypothetical protein